MRWRGTSIDTADRPVKSGSLQERLLEIKAGIAQYVRPDNQAINERVIAELRERAVQRNVLLVGSEAPDFELPDQGGKPISSCDLRAQGKLLIHFYRGRWCPFCMTTLEAWREALPDIQALGAAFCAISPQLVRHSAFTADQHRLRFPVLSDAGNAVARAFGLVYEVPDHQRELFRRVFVSLENLNGMRYEEWSLPIPATFVIGQDGKILFADANPDYMQRTEPSEIVSLLRA